MTEITIKDAYGTCTVINKKDDLDIWEIGELIKMALAGRGYHPDNIELLFGDNEDA